MYKVELKLEASKDLDAFSHPQKILIFKQFKKLESSPQLGEALGNKAGYDLSGYRKMYVDKKKIRIVYRIIEDRVVVEIIAIAKRDDMSVYKKANERK
jgi:mRNA interferase RelE/StbE